MKEIILNSIRNAKELYDKRFDEGFNSALDDFIDDAYSFYEFVMGRARVRGLNDFEPVLFTTICYKCGEPIVFTHNSKNVKEIMRILQNAFDDWKHEKC